MRVAIVHDFLCQRGGAERFVLSLCRLLADPLIVTSLYVPEATFPEVGHYEVRAARQGTLRDAERFRRRALSYPSTFADLEVDDAEVVLVSTSAFAHHVRHPRSLVYWHTTPRFLYQPAAYLRGSVTSRLAATGISPLRRADRRAALAHVGHAANSRRTADRLVAAYGIDAPIIHPPLDLDRLGLWLAPLPATPRALVVSRLLPYKRVDLAITACARAGIPLTVVGAGPDAARLHRLAPPGEVRFLEDVDDDALNALYASHSVVVAPAVDDFGYVPLEAAYAGRPSVVADAGGLNDTVVDRRTGRLVEGDDPSCWAEAITEVLSTPWPPERLRAHAAGFGHDVFAEQLRGWLAGVTDPAAVMATHPDPLSSAAG